MYCDFVVLYTNFECFLHKYTPANSQNICKCARNILSIINVLPVQRIVGREYYLYSK